MSLTTLKVIEFKTEYRHNPETGKNDRPVDMVLLTNLNKHRHSETWHRVKDLIPKKEFDASAGGQRESDIQAFFNARWAIIGPHYENFKRGTKTDIEGTLLASWPLLNQNEVQAFNRAGIHTVEEVAALSDSAINRVHLPDLRGKKREAQKFLDNSDKVALQKRVEALEAIIAGGGTDKTSKAVKAPEKASEPLESAPEVPVADEPALKTRAAKTKSRPRQRRTSAVA